MGTNSVYCSRLAFLRPRWELGETIKFCFRLHIEGPPGQTAVLEYAIDFKTESGELQSKVFKLHERVYPPGIFIVASNYTFKDLKSRKHYPGQHFLRILLNGEECLKKPFLLLDSQA